MTTNTQTIDRSEALEAYQQASGFHEQPEPQANTGPESKSPHDLLNEAFELVSTDFSCRLPDLLLETRRLGISDQKVRELISEDETGLASGSDVGDRKFSCWWNAKGIGYVNRNTGADGRLATINELFAELSESGPPATYTGPPQSLSQLLLECGEELTEMEACILDTAQTLNKKFQHGTATGRRPLGRVVMKYHRQLGSYDKLTKASNALSNRGICRVEKEQIRLIKFVDRKQNKDVSRFTKLVDDERLVEVLAACDDCVGSNFEMCQAMASRSAVSSLVIARFRVSKNVFKMRLRELYRLGILEAVTTRGNTSLRMTMEAGEKMKLLKMKTTTTALRAFILETYSDEQRRSGLIHKGEELSPLGCALVSAAAVDFDVDQIEVGYLWATFKKQGFSFQEFRRAIGELIACERARLLEAIADGNPVCHLELMDNRYEPEAIPISYAMETIQKLDPAATVG